MGLTPKQALFVREYLVDLNATQAAIRAGYSAKTADTQGPRLLENVGVRAAIDEAKKARSERVDVKADDILRELMRLAMVDIGEAFNEHGQLKALHEMSPDVRRAIASIEHQHIGGTEMPGVIAKVKFWDKVKGLELLGKHLKLFTDKFEVEGKVTLEQLVSQATARGKR